MYRHQAPLHTSLCLRTHPHAVCVSVCVSWIQCQTFKSDPWTAVVWTHSMTPRPQPGTLSAGQRACCYMRGFRCVITPIYSAGSSINTQLHTSLHLRFTRSRGTEKFFTPGHKQEWQQILSKQYFSPLAAASLKKTEIRSYAGYTLHETQDDFGPDSPLPTIGSKAPIFPDILVVWGMLRVFLHPPIGSGSLPWPHRFKSWTLNVFNIYNRISCCVWGTPRTADDAVTRERTIENCRHGGHG